MKRLILAVCLALAVTATPAAAAPRTEYKPMPEQVRTRVNYHACLPGHMPIDPIANHTRCNW